MENKTIIDQYEIEADKIKVIVKILGGKGLSLKYIVEFPKFSPATVALLNEVKEELIMEVKLSAREILDPKVINELKNKFYKKTEDIIKIRLPGLDAISMQYLSGSLIHEMVGLGDIEFLLGDMNLEEIVINSSHEPIRVYHKKHGWLETNLTIESEEQIQNYSSIIARRVGRQISTLAPLLDAHLVTGDRANAVLYPICNKGNTITIRKFARDPWTVTDFITNKTISSEVAALIWLAMQYELNILVSGGTASGKTSLLNVMMPFIPPNHRIISIEDTRELMLPSFLYWCPLTTRQPNPEGKGEVSMLDLLVNSLRMRPDRIILGEMRRKAEAEVLFEAMHTGHSVYATVHADSLNETVRRLINPPIEIPSNLLSAINLNVVMFRDRRLGLRRIYHMGEYLVPEEGAIKTNLLYRWNPTTDTIVKHSASIRLFEDLSRHTGFNQREIDKNLKEKMAILDWMVKNKIRDIESVGDIIREYYLNQESILKKVGSIR